MFPDHFNDLNNGILGLGAILIYCDMIYRWNKSSPVVRLSRSVTRQMAVLAERHHKEVYNKSQQRRIWNCH